LELPAKEKATQEKATAEKATAGGPKYGRDGGVCQTPDQAG
jgi:hypothetical protein